MFVMLQTLQVMQIRMGEVSFFQGSGWWYWFFLIKKKRKVRRGCGVNFRFYSLEVGRGFKFKFVGFLYYSVFVYLFRRQRVYLFSLQLACSFIYFSVSVFVYLFWRQCVRFFGKCFVIGWVQDRMIFFGFICFGFGCWQSIRFFWGRSI